MTATVLHGTARDCAQELADQCTALDPQQVDASVVPYQANVDDHCEHNHCTRLAAAHVSTSDPLTGHRMAGQYCVEHTRQQVSWLLMDEARALAHNPSLVDVECWRAG